MLTPKDFENSISGIRDLVKQLLTLSTGIIALTITFSKDFIQLSGLSSGDRYLIGVSWLLFLFSIICGVLALMAINGLHIQIIWGKIKIAPFDEQETNYPDGFRSTLLYFGIQVIFFLLALVLIIVYGFRLI